MAKHTIESLANEFLSIHELDKVNDYNNIKEMLKAMGFRTSRDNIWKILNTAKRLAGDDLEELEFE
jgi:CRISPR/Cas system CMR-associated protein Cmr5 small subunit